MKWTKMPRGSLPSEELHLLTVDGVEKGFVSRPYDTNGDRNAWRCFIGIGDNAKFLGHRWTLEAAKAVVQSLL